MGIFFTKPKKSRVSDHDKAVLQLKIQMDMLKQYEKRIEKSLESERQLAKKLLNEGKRDRAKLLLRKKKIGEQLLSKAYAHMDNLSSMINEIELSGVNQDVFAALKLGNEALTKVNALISIEDVEKILDETRESIEKQREIDEMLQGVLTSQDEDDVETEFDKLMLDVQTPQVEPRVPIVEPEEYVSLPEVPTEEPFEPVTEAKEDEIQRDELEKQKSKAKGKVPVLA